MFNGRVALKEREGNEQEEKQKEMAEKQFKVVLLGEGKETIVKWWKMCLLCMFHFRHRGREIPAKKRERITRAWEWKGEEDCMGVCNVLPCVVVVAWLCVWRDAS